MKGIAGAVIVACGALLAARADDPKAPLADTKQQLQQLRRDDVAAKSGAEDTGLKGALPSLQSTLQGREVLPATVLDPNQDANARRQARKDQAAKNWLVNGFDRLDPKASREKKDGRTEAAPAGADADATDSSTEAPDDLISIYQKRPAANSGKQPGAGASADKEPALRTDPLAPFLQGWLANSPVKDAVLPSSHLSGGRATDPAVFGREPLIPDATAAPGEWHFGPEPNDQPLTAATNPYLANVSLPPLTAPVIVPPLPAGGGDGGSAEPAPSPTLAPAAEAAAAPAKAETFKPPPTPADEDKKYFPQLKRF